MKRLSPAWRKARGAFTLIEMLVVVATLGILAGLLLPVLGPAKIRSLKALTRAEERGLIAGISQYDADYSHLPASAGALAAAGTNDFTFGTMSLNAPLGTGVLSPIPVVTPGENSYQNNNSEVMAILRDDNFWPETNATRQHLYNPRKNPYFNAKMAMDTASPGIGTDDVLRDPWGNPYIVTLDLNEDHQCYDATLDAMYQLQTPKPPGPLMIPEEAAVWSFGSLKTINLGQPLNSAYTNKQTIVYSF